MKLPVLILSLMLSITSTAAAVRGIKTSANTSPSSVNEENFDFGDEAIFQINMRRLAKKGIMKGQAAAIADAYSKATKPMQNMGNAASKSGTPASSPTAESPASSPVGTEAPVISTCCDCSSNSGGSKGTEGMFLLTWSVVTYFHLLLTCISLNIKGKYGMGERALKGRGGSKSGTISKSGKGGSKSGTVGKSGKGGSKSGTVGKSGKGGSKSGTVGKSGKGGSKSGTVGKSGKASKGNKIGRAHV